MSRANVRISVQATSAPARTRKPRTEGKGDVDELGLSADRAVRVRRATEVAGDPQQLRLGVADVEAREPAAPELTNDTLASEPILDLRQAGWDRSPG